MQTVTTIGLDIAKSVFQVHGIDAEGNVMLRRQLKRRYVLAFFHAQASIPTRHGGSFWSRGPVLRLSAPIYWR
jgi:transposase